MTMMRSSADNGDGGELIFEQVAVLVGDAPRVRITVAFRHDDAGVDQRVSITVPAQTAAALLRDVTPQNAVQIRSGCQACEAAFREHGTPCAEHQQKRLHHGR